MGLTMELINVEGEMLGIITKNATEAAWMLRGYFSQAEGQDGVCAVGCVEKEGGPAWQQRWQGSVCSGVLKSSSAEK